MILLYSKRIRVKKFYFALIRVSKRVEYVPLITSIVLQQQRALHVNDSHELTLMIKLNKTLKFSKSFLVHS